MLKLNRALMTITKVRGILTHWFDSYWRGEAERHIRQNIHRHYLGEIIVMFMAMPQLGTVTNGRGEKERDGLIHIPIHL